MAPRWTEADDRIAATLPPAEAARKLGRTIQAVYHRRHKLETGLDQTPWSEAEDRLLMRVPFDVAVRHIERPAWAIDQRRRKLGLVEDRRRRPG